MAVLLQGASGAWAAGLHVVGSFATPEIPFPLTSIAVDTDRGTLLLGGPDGSINEFTRSGFFLEPVVPAGLVDGIRSPCDRGLAYVPIPEPRIYSSGGMTFTGLFRYSRSGEYQAAFALRGYQSYQGLCFEPRGSTGVLFLLERYDGSIHAYTFTRERDFVGPRFEYSLDLPYEEGREVTGLVSLTGRDAFLISLERAELLLAVHGNASPAHGEVVACEIAGRIDLRALGIEAVHDLAYDPGTDSLYVADGSQGKVFALAFTASVPFHRGDTDGSGGLNVTDAVRILDFLFNSGGRPECLAAGDSNADRRLDVSDAVSLLRFLFSGGPEPPEPGPPESACGEDALIGLGCEIYPGCRDEGRGASP